MWGAQWRGGLFKILAQRKGFLEELKRAFTVVIKSNSGAKESHVPLMFPFFSSIENSKCNRIATSPQLGCLLISLEARIFASIGCLLSGSMLNMNATILCI